MCEKVKSNAEVSEIILQDVVRICPSTPTGQAQGCILPPQVSSNLPPVGVTKWDTVCCSFLEESLDRTNCVVEEDIYLILGDILEKDDVVLEVNVALLARHVSINNQNVQSICLSLNFIDTIKR